LNKRWGDWVTGRWRDLILIMDLEDWLLSQNPQFIKKMRKARQEDLGGKGKNWESLKKELCIE